MITDAIKILLIEDNPADALLVQRQIKKIVASPDIKCIDLYEEFISSMESFKPDIILCDYRLKGYTGADILNYMNMHMSHYTPLVFVTGAIKDEELAADSILSGASGYILKNNISTLHEKLLPHFEKISNIKNNVLTDNYIKLKVDQLKSYLDTVKEDKAIDLITYNEMKKAFDKLKYLLD